VADNTSITLYRGAAATSSTTLYTSPTNIAVCVTNIAICNDSASSVTASLSLGGVPLFSSLTVAANTTTYLTPDQIIYNGEVIAGSSSVTTTDFHIAGYEVI
jgi:lipopolysaccharide assembly outer membrane protein LptD (OstA)